MMKNVPLCHSLPATLQREDLGSLREEKNVIRLAYPTLIMVYYPEYLVKLKS